MITLQIAPKLEPEIRAYKPKYFKQIADILVIDDCAINIKVMTYYLQQLGCISDVAYDGVEGIFMVEKGSYGIVFMDMQMPVKSGFEATREIRSKGINIPIIAISAGITDSEMQTIREVGMNEFLLKPAHIKDVTEILLKYSIIVEAKSS